MSEVIMLSNVRISFPHIIEPQVKDGRAMYNAVFIVHESHEGFRNFMNIVGKAALEKWKDKTPAVMGIINGDAKKRCYAAGDTRINQKTFQVYDGYAGNMVISANNKNAPQIYNAAGEKVDPNNTMQYRSEAGKIYGGCYVNVVLKPWVQDNTHGVGIRCDLVAIQFAKDGTPFGSNSEPDLSSVFGTVATPAAAAPAAAGMPPFLLP